MCIPKYFYFSKYGCTFVTAVHSSQNCSKRCIKQKYGIYKLRQFLEIIRCLIVKILKMTIKKPNNNVVY